MANKIKQYNKDGETMINKDNRNCRNCKYGTNVESNTVFKCMLNDELYYFFELCEKFSKEDELKYKK